MSPSRRTRVTWRRAGAPVVVAAIALLAAGCGSGSGDTATSPTSKVPTQQQDSSLNAKLPNAVQKAGVIKIGTEALYPPFESFGSDNKTIVGLDPDLANALGQVLGVKVSMTHTAFDGLLTALDGGRFDIVMAAITDTKARQAKYDFADYFTTGQAIVVKKGNPAGIKGVPELCGKSVSVLTASTQEKLLGEFNTKECAAKKIKVTALPSDKDALLQVQTGRADANFTQDAVGRYNAKTIGGGNQFEVANSAPMLPTPVGVVFTKDNTQLRDAFKAALEQLISNGTYEKILAKHDLAGGAVQTVTINGGTT
ncbi:MAG: polar amino acid transport system substrate-binding protein [Actinomycetota bacterium]|jgi:polar amino acid transport system substrate-binding protein|nr:polar amino acid transport system substrate-binding protein [Actinomycetota bacterium]